MESDKVNYVSLINQTIKTLSNKERITGAIKQQAIRFYHWLGEYLPDVDQETKNKYKEYEQYLRKAGILQW